MTEFHDPDDETFGEITYHVGRKGRFVADAADTVIVYHYAIDMYTGGAHGSYVPFTLNFSKRTGLAISISDVLDTAHERAILDIMLARLLKDNDCSTREELIEKTGILGLGDLYRQRISTSARTASSSASDNMTLPPIPAELHT